LTEVSKSYEAGNYVLQTNIVNDSQQSNKARLRMAFTIFFATGNISALCT
jgi:hypothetical protein